MPSEDYRFYCLDRFGRLHNAEWFYAETDEDAIAQIEGPPDLPWAAAIGAPSRHEHRSSRPA